MENKTRKWEKEPDPGPGALRDVVPYSCLLRKSAEETLLVLVTHESALLWRGRVFALADGWAVRTTDFPRSEYRIVAPDEF